MQAITSYENLLNIELVPADRDEEWDSLASMLGLDPHENGYDQVISLPVPDLMHALRRLVLFIAQDGAYYDRQAGQQLSQVAGLKHAVLNVATRSAVHPQNLEAYREDLLNALWSTLAVAVRLTTGRRFKPQFKKALTVSAVARAEESPQPILASEPEVQPESALTPVASSYEKVEERVSEKFDTLEQRLQKEKFSIMENKRYLHYAKRPRDGDRQSPKINLHKDHQRAVKMIAAIS